MKLFKKRAPRDEALAAERRLRYAVVFLLDASGGDSEWVTDVVEMAEWDWRKVND